jgi:hypothetical protein
LDAFRRAIRRVLDGHLDGQTLRTLNHAAFLADSPFRSILANEDTPRRCLLRTVMVVLSLLCHAASLTMPVDEPTPPLPSIEEMRYQALYALLKEIREAIHQSNHYLDFIARRLAEEPPLGDLPAAEG